MATVLDALVQQSLQLQDLGRQLDRKYGPGIRALEELGRQASPALKAASRAAEELTRQASPGIRALEELGRQASPALKAASRAAEELTRQASPGIRALEELGRQASPALKAAARAAEELTRQASPGIRALEELGRQASPALKAAARAAEELTRQASPGIRALEELGRQASPALKAAARAAEELQQSPALKAALFGAAWDERLEAAVGRLERVADIPDAPDPKQAVEELFEDAAILEEKAATSEARKWVKRYVRIVIWLVWQIVIVPVLSKMAWEGMLTISAPLTITSPDLPQAPNLPTTREIKPVSTALTLPDDLAVGFPAIVERAGPAAAERVVEFFTAQIRNANTRAAYAKAVTQFFTWCDERGLELDEISPVAIAAYIEELQGVYRAPTIKQHLAAIRRLFDWLVVGQVVPWNPTAAVRGPTHVVKRGKTPVLQPGEVRLLLDSIDTSAIGGLRDQALIGVMIYSFARVSAVVNMDVDDYYQQGKRWWLRLNEKGGKHHALPVHHRAEAYLDAYLAGGGIAGERGSPLWRSLTRTRELGERRMSRVDVFRMVKRRVKAAELGAAANCHTFRASGITAYLLNGGTLERAQAIAGHESPRTTQLYDRTADDITVEDIERIRV